MRNINKGLKNTLSFIFAFVLLCTLVLVSGCEVVDSSVDKIDFQDKEKATLILGADLSTVKLEVETKNGETKIIDLNASMLSEADARKLSEEGIHSIIVNYNGMSRKLKLIVRQGSK